MAQDTSQNPCVFLVDDDSDIRASLSRALKLRQYDVKTFASAAEFLEFYDGSIPGCLLLDYGMPKMNGLQLQKHLRDEGISVPIIFITGHGGIPESVEAMKMGAVDFLEKPFKQSVLIKQIDAAIEADASRRASMQQTSGLMTRYNALTEREKEIARILSTHTDRNTSKDIARELGISPRTVDHHRARVLEKMGVSSVAELVEATLKAGVFTEGDSLDASD